MAISPSGKYQHIFFDLDHTLWDFESNSRHTLSDLFYQFDLQSIGVPSMEEFLTVYERINSMLWHQYAQKQIDKLTLRNTRFIHVLSHWEIENHEIANEINEHYLLEGPKKTGLLPNALETLNYLKSKYHLHLITNGFSEVQDTKLNGSGLSPFFTSITTSEKTGFLKPDIRVFEIALQSAKASKIESLYVGDHYETDVIGSKNAGIDQVYFNPSKQKVSVSPTFDIADLIELTRIL